MVDEAGAYQHRVHGSRHGAGKCHSFRYRLLSPTPCEDDTLYPLVLFLHGAGERGTDNDAQLKYFPSWMAEARLREQYPCFVIAPQCRPEKTWSAAPWDSIECDPLPTASTDDLAAAVELLDDLVTMLPIDQRRIYLTGLSMGGYGAWELALRHPDRFAAVVPICGGGDEALAARLVNVPIWAWHGEADDVVPVARSRRMIAAIKQAGGNPRYTELAGVGHDSWTPAYRGDQGVIPWMFAQRRT